MRGPFGGVGVDEGGEFCLWVCGVWIATGEDVDLVDGVVVEEGGEDAGALMRS